ncbi:MAG: TVP38/TMEM64 family protein [Cyanobacteria bacterium J06641_5]
MKSWLKYLLIAIAVAVVIILGAKFGVFAQAQVLLNNAITWIEGLGPLAPIAFIITYIVASVLFISGTALTLGAGAIFGVVKGTIFVSAGSVLGAAAAFLVGRYLARDRIAKIVEKNPKFAAVDEAVAREGWKIVGLTRLSPIFPFVVLNYAFGLTKVKFLDYFLASWIGMLPGTILYVYIGSIVKAVADAGGDEPGGALKNILFVVGLLATAAVTVYVTRIAQKALNSKLEGTSAAGEAEVEPQV